MTVSTFVAALCFATLFAGLWIAVFGLRGARKAKEEGHVSALAQPDGRDVNGVTEPKKA